VQYNKAIVGRNAFAHESGIHQDGMLKHTQTYEIMLPEDVGVKQTSLVMGKHSGTATAFVHKLEEAGYRLAGNQLEDAFVRFKALADRKKHVYDEDLEALVDEEIATAQGSHQARLTVCDRGTRGPQRATMKLDIDGPLADRGARLATVRSTRPLTASKRWLPHEAKLELYSGARGDRKVPMRRPKSRCACRRRAAASPPRVPTLITLVASAKAYLAALNKARGAAAARRTAKSARISLDGCGIATLVIASLSAAIQRRCFQSWIASSLPFLAMTAALDIIARG